jgi:hypothetical protein
MQDGRAAALCRIISLRDAAFGFRIAAHACEHHE